ncbi:hypothetical protein I304_01064, partial [Cryptococcus deuterogattii CBS 10090]
MKVTLPLAITVSLLSSIAFASPTPASVGSATERGLARSGDSISHDVVRSLAGALDASRINAVKRQQDASTGSSTDATSGNGGTTDGTTTDSGTTDGTTTDSGTTDGTTTD